VPPAARPPHEPTRIVIAADDREFSESLRSSVEAHEALDVVGIAGDGTEAIRLVETLKPSLVLMDSAMPGMDGIETTRRLSELPDSPAVVLMISEEDATDSRIVGAGAAAYVRKNGDLDSILDIVIAFACASKKSFWRRHAGQFGAGWSPPRIPR
jgi:DNA-binding NarL/FixJ family response regulator